MFEYPDTNTRGVGKILDSYATLDFASGLHKGAVFNYWGGERTDKFWGRVAIYWRPIWGGLKFSEPVFRGGVVIFWAPLGDGRVLRGFVSLKY